MFFDEHNKFHSAIRKGKGKYGVSVDDPSYQRLRSRDYRASHPELEQYYEDYRANNREKLIQYLRTYNKVHKEEMLKAAKERYEHKLVTESEEERKERQQKRSAYAKKRYLKIKATETQEEKQTRLERDRKYQAKRVAKFTSEEYAKRLSYLRNYWASMSPERRKEVLAKKREQSKENYARKKAEKKGIAV